jgi:hypothetical protein
MSVEAASLDTLKKGLKILKKTVQARKLKLEAQLAERKSISREDEDWLDNEASFIDEQRVIDTLEEASDYEKQLLKLNDAEKVCIKKLREAAGDLPKVAGKKRKGILYL